MSFRIFINDSVDTPRLRNECHGQGNGIGGDAPLSLLLFLIAEECQEICTLNNYKLPDWRLRHDHDDF